MKKTKEEQIHYRVNADETSDEVIENITELQARGIDPESTKVNIFIGEDKIGVNSDFVMLFASNLQRLLCRNKLTINEMKILLTIVTYSQYRNMFKVSQKAIAKETGIHKGNVSKYYKSLKEKGIILEDENENEFINPYLFVKGKMKEMKATKLFKSMHLLQYDDDIENPF